MISVKTVKNRGNRARTRLSVLLALDGADRFGPDDMTYAIVTTGAPVRGRMREMSAQ
jgi:hypothetical protein